MLSDVRLQSLETITPHDEPQLESSESSTQGDPPVSVVDGLLRVSVLQVDGVNDHGVGKLITIAYPQARDVKVGQQPLVGVGVEGGRVCGTTLVQVLQLRTDKSVAGISAVNVHPNVPFLANRPDFGYVIERAT